MQNTQDSMSFANYSQANIKKPIIWKCSIKCTLILLYIILNKSFKCNMLYGMRIGAVLKLLNFHLTDFIDLGSTYTHL